MKLCTCNHCGEVYEDMNPQVDAPDYPDVPGIKQLILLYENPSEKKDTGYWGCPVCCTDAYLTDDIDTMNIWTLTDHDTQQYGRRLSTYKYEFKEKDKVKTVIDLERYSWQQICDVCESYYENMDELFKQYGEKSTWIIAECIFESGPILS